MERLNGGTASWLENRPESLPRWHISDTGEVSILYGFKYRWLQAGVIPVGVGKTSIRDNIVKNAATIKRIYTMKQITPGICLCVQCINYDIFSTVNGWLENNKRVPLPNHFRRQSRGFRHTGLSYQALGREVGWHWGTLESGAVSPARFRGRAPGQRVQGPSPQKLKTFRCISSNFLYFLAGYVENTASSFYVHSFS